MGKSDPSAEGFQLPDYSSDVDFAAHIAAVPANATAKGMFFRDLVEAIREHAPQELESLRLAQQRYLPFSDYSQRDYHKFVAQATEILYPDLPSAEGVRRVGWGTFPRFVDSVLGRVVVGVFLDDPNRLTAAMAKAWQYTASPGSVDAVRLGDGDWRHQIRNTPGAIRAFIAGCAEGVLRHYELEPTVLVREVGLHSFDLSIQW